MLRKRKIQEKIENNERRCAEWTSAQCQSIVREWGK